MAERARRTRAAADVETTPAEDEGQPIPPPVVGEQVGTADDGQVLVRPSIATQNAQADRAVGRTTQQVGLPVIIVGLSVWAARLLGIDLNPLPGEEEIPADVGALWVGLFTVLLARHMNPKTKNES